MLQKLAIFSIVAVVLSALALSSVAFAHNPKERAVFTKVADFAFVDQGPSGLSIGDRFTSNGQILDPNRRVIGIWGGESIVVGLKDRRPIEQLTQVFQFPEGELVAVSIAQPEEVEDTMAIVGGTGDFRKAAGEILVQSLEEEGKAELTILLR